MINKDGTYLYTKMGVLSRWKARNIVCCDLAADQIKAHATQTSKRVYTFSNGATSVHIVLLSTIHIYVGSKCGCINHKQVHPDIEEQIDVLLSAFDFEQSSTYGYLISVYLK